MYWDIFDIVREYGIKLASATLKIQQMNKSQVLTTGKTTSVGILKVIRL